MSTSHLERAEHMLTWLTAQGGYVHPAAELRNTPSGLSLFATSPIRADERLISCPFAAAITAERASRAVAEATGVPESALVWPSGEPWNERMRVAAYVGLHWVFEDELPASLVHAPYIAALPPPSTLTTPLYFTPAERALLTGTNLAGAVADREREWAAESEAVRTVLKQEGLTWERYLAVATYLSSRAFPSALLRLPDGTRTNADGSGATSNGDATGSANGAADANGANGHASDGEPDSDESHPVLLPGLDMLNHARGQPIQWLSSRIASADGDVPAISFMSAAPIGAGTEVLNNYGAKSNEQLLLAYGFVIPSNPDDRVVLRLGRAHAPGIDARLASRGLSATERFALGRDGELPRRLLQVVRVMLGEGGSTSGGSTCASDDEDSDDEHAAHEHEVEELERELDVLGMLGGMLEEKLGKIQRDDEDEGEHEGEVRAEVAEMCSVYRAGQADIINTALDRLSERIDRIERLMDEGMECPCGC